MAHTPGANRKGKEWTGKEVARVRELAKVNTPTPLIANIIGRTPAAIQTKASEKGISLKPVNKSPYTRRT